MRTSQREIEEIFRYGARVLGVPADLCERQYIPVPDEADFSTIASAWNKAAAQLGSVGGGKHFIEMQVDRDDGSVWAMIHCGSRGYGCAYQSGCSVNHGAGRLMSRSQARLKLTAIHDQIDQEMHGIRRTLGGVEITGIAGNTRRTPLDECGHVYKDLDEVLGVLEAEGIARVAHRLYPVANIKGVN